MVYVNSKPMEWHPLLDFSEIYSFLGYTIKQPLVITRVNGRRIPKNERNNYKIPDNARIEVLNLLRGG